MAEARGNRKTRTGVVVSDKMDKTIVVEIRTRVKHSVYAKTVNITKRLKVHDENNECGVGDRVRHRRLRDGDGNQAAFQGQALAPGGDHRKGEVTASKEERSNDSASNQIKGRR